MRARFSRENSSRGQLNIEFILAVLFALILFISVFSVYSSNARFERERQVNSDASSAAQSLGGAINILAASPSLTTSALSLPSGDYSVSLANRRVVSRISEREFTYPLITNSVVFDSESFKAGSSLTLRKSNGAIHVSSKQ